jgi:hypothetical protein
LNIESSCSGFGAKKAAIAIAATLLIVVCARQAPGLSKHAASFPEGYDAVTAAPGSHKVIFENALVRVLEVTIFATINQGMSSEMCRALRVRFTRVIGLFIG